MDKKQIIKAILQKQNSISDTSSNSSGSDTELKIQPKKEENTQPLQKEENFIVYESENTETDEEANIETTETEEEEKIETIKKLPNKNITYINRCSDLQAY